ncbi:D-ribose pyranase [Ignatzschineria rhizosphaerae]|uniref:D-ribose pyranase n=1 Tax=Ignatzschineria rhizosphaerae TaxID=2923279 RepID=A0ABY3X1R8_9GAMM|nr:D-ribose pyranase [Ignatzschineria rhizosphaerae]UNM96819.1 D-ribose pyranase [Ignatzschineria rhizosphaerae]
MIKSSMLNSAINGVLAKLGHTDQIVIADAGLPIPNSTERIDLALVQGVPSFLETLRAVLPVMQVEKIILAKEIQTQNLQLHEELLQLIAYYSGLDSSKKPIEIMYISHEAFKAQTKVESCKAVIRTGECTPYANIILESGVVF